MARILFSIGLAVLTALLCLLLAQLVGCPPRACLVAALLGLATAFAGSWRFTQPHDRYIKGITQ